MSVRGMVFEGKLEALRKAVGRLPARLRPTPTCMEFRAAAGRLGISRTALRHRLRGRRWGTLRLDGNEVIALSVVEMLRR